MNILKEKRENASILQRIANGDQTAVQNCLDKYGNLLWSLAKKYTNRREDAEDAVQEIFIDIWKNAARFDDTKAAEITFVVLIAKRRLIDRLRKTTRLPQFQDLDSVLVSQPKNSETQMQISLDAGHAAKIINRFRPDRKQVLQLAIYAGLTHSEIAEQTGMPLGTVKTHIRRGFQKVRASFGGKNESFSNLAFI